MIASISEINSRAACEIFYASDVILRLSLWLRSQVWLKVLTEVVVAFWLCVILVKQSRVPGCWRLNFWILRAPACGRVASVLEQIPIACSWNWIGGELMRGITRSGSS